MKRRALLGLALLMLGAPDAQAITKQYSTGSIHAPIGARLDRALVVPDAGPVSFVRVSFRITAPRTSALAISLVSPRGTAVPLVVHRGTGADFGNGERGCSGLLASFQSDATTKVTAAASPFTSDEYRPEGDLRSLDGQQARGRWLLRIDNDGPPATLDCFTLDVSRSVPQTLRAQAGSVRASVSFTERNYAYQHQQLTIVRAGRTVLDAPLTRLGCRDCSYTRPVSLRVRDLDGGEPEVLLDLFTGGAHCCSDLLVLRYVPSTGSYRSTLLDFGNYGYRLVDLDHDGLPEFAAFDERFVYAFTAYVFSVAPPRIVQYRHGRLIDVTRRFPAAIEANARSNWRLYKQSRGQRDVDVRGVLAAYVADEELLGRPGTAKQALDQALARGDLYRGNSYLGWPAGREYVATLMRDLRRWGYVR